MAMIEVKYSCTKCGVNKTSVMVVARSPREDVVEFVNRAALQCKADHDGRSTQCKINKLDELMIPVENENRIGDVATRQ